MTRRLFFSRQPVWIPPSGLLGGHLAHGASWVALWLLAEQKQLFPSPHAIAWIHLVALGWLSLTALSVLLFVLPQFSGLQWRGEVWARSGLVVFALSVVAMIAAFWAAEYARLSVAAFGVVIGLGTYLAAAGMTLGARVTQNGQEGAIARAFSGVLLFFAAAALLGLLMARGLAYNPGGIPGYAAPIHAGLAGIGWLTLLVMGVSARTVGPITGRRSPRRWAHVISSSLVTLGVVLLAFGLWKSTVLMDAAIVALVVGFGIYAFDMLELIASSTVCHRPPQAFLAAAITWLIVACLLGVGIVAGRREFEPAYVFVGLIGWLGQMVVGHMHHIGVRLIATLVRGDDDETPPDELLHTALSWTTFLSFQAAVGIACVALISARTTWMQAGAAIGLIGWIAMTANMIVAMKAAVVRRPAA